MKTFKEYITEMYNSPKGTHTFRTPEEEHALSQKDSRMTKDILSVTPSSKEVVDNMHKATLPKENDIHKGATLYQNSSENINRRMRNNMPLGKDEMPAIESLKKVIGRGSDKLGASTKASGRVFHGQSYPPKLDKDGHIKTLDLTSWSTNPSTASRFSKSKTDPNQEAHHVFIMNHKHDNDVGHRLFSLAPIEHNHGKTRSEMELVSGPAKYKFSKTKLSEPHPDTGKPVYEYHVTPTEMHPDWKANSSGTYSKEEANKKVDWHK